MEWAKVATWCGFGAVWEKKVAEGEAILRNVLPNGISLGLKGIEGDSSQGELAEGDQSSWRRGVGGFGLNVLTVPLRHCRRLSHFRRWNRKHCDHQQGVLGGSCNPD